MLSEIILHDVEENCGHLDRDFFNNKKVLITGSSGLIGTYLFAYMVFLVRNGINVEVCALTCSPPPDHMQELLQDSKISVLQIDLADQAQYHRLPEADIIIHSACYAQPMLFMANPVSTLQLNVTATIALLQQLRPQGSFMFVSSAEVYCGLTESFFREESIGTTTPYHPRASYIEGKRAGEAVCNAFRSQGARAISVRLGDVYGPGTRKHDKRALNSFIEKALLKKEIDLLDSGKAMRVYCYVSDALELMIKIMMSGKEAVYNVGGESYVSIAEVAQLIAKITDSEVVFPTDEIQVAGAPVALRLDLSRVKAEFGKNEYLALTDGLSKTIAWQQILYSS